MTVDDVERQALLAAADWAFIQYAEAVDKTEHTVKLRLYITAEFFVQVYANTQKQLSSCTLIFNRMRILGRECDGGVWHRHPADDPDQHDFSAEGQRPVTLDEFLREAQQVLQSRSLL